MWGLFRLIAIALTLVLGACAINYPTVGLGRLGGRVLTMWVGENDFVYVPAPGAAFYFETSRTDSAIQPGLMYTDGGSIPRLAQALKGFSPWGFGPAYVIHDWIFFGRHCIVDGQDDKRFNDIRNISFDQSALILAEAIRTLVDYGQVPQQIFAADVISNAVDTTVARQLWDQTGACRPVSTWHIAVLWKAVLGKNAPSPPPSWKLSPREIEEARKKLPLVPDVISPEHPAPLDPDKVVLKNANPKIISRSTTPGGGQISLSNASQ